MSKLSVEYLIIVESKDSFCKTPESLIHLLMSNDDIKISSNTLKYKNENYEFKLQQGTTNSSHGFFHLWITCTDISKIDFFEELLKIIRTLLYKANDKQPQVLWDDVSLFYADTAYPLIHDIENTMRKLITKFMLIKIGLGWANEAIPQEVINSIKSKNKSNAENYLYEVDFIQLSKFLFNEYTTSNIKNILNKIKSIKNKDEIDLLELKSIVPKSNWERYFDPIIKCERDFLQKRWEMLYDLRNKIAHNKFISKQDFDEIKSLINEIKPILQSAIEKFDEINVPDEDKDKIAENIASNVNSLYEIFLNSWNNLHRLLFEYTILTTNKEEEDISKTIQSANNVRSLLNILHKKRSIITSKLRKDILEIFKFRNVIVHHSDVIFPEENITVKTEEVIDCIKELENKISQFNDGLDVIENINEDETTAEA